MQLSVLIRNLNQSAELEVCLKALQLQQVDFDYEIVVVDNESDDNSVEIANKYGCKVISLQREKFTYGKALNLGIEHCNGDFILILSSHVFLLSEFFLQKIPKLFTNEKIAGLKFIPVTNNQSIKNAFKHNERLVDWQTEKQSMMNVWLHGTVNNCAAIRKNIWQLIPYNEALFYSEDKVWSYEVMKAGYSLKINNPLFYHYHKTMDRKQLLTKRAMEEASYRIITGKPYLNYPTTIGKKIEYVFRQLRAYYLRIDAFFKINRIVKKTILSEKDKFKF